MAGLGEWHEPFGSRGGRGLAAGHKVDGGSLSTSGLKIFTREDGMGLVLVGFCFFSFFGDLIYVRFFLWFSRVFCLLSGGFLGFAMFCLKNESSLVCFFPVLLGFGWFGLICLGWFCLRKPWDFASKIAMGPNLR